jgi:putative endonuclease
VVATKWCPWQKRRSCHEVVASPKTFKGDMVPFAYILRSEKDGNYYYGSTGNIEKRIKSHNSGKVISTKNRRPLVIHYFEEYISKKEAIQQELFFKSIEGYRWLKENKII